MILRSKISKEASWKITSNVIWLSAPSAKNSSKKILWPLRSPQVKICGSKRKTRSIAHKPAKITLIWPQSWRVASPKILVLWTNCKCHPLTPPDYSWIPTKPQELTWKRTLCTKTAPTDPSRPKPAAHPYCPKITRDREALAPSISVHWNTAEDTTCSGNGGTPKRSRPPRDRSSKAWRRPAVKYRLTRSCDCSKTV